MREFRTLKEPVQFGTTLLAVLVSIVKTSVDKITKTHLMVAKYCSDWDRHPSQSNTSQRERPMYDVCVKYNDEYITLVSSNTIANAIHKFREESVRRAKENNDSVANLEKFVIIKGNDVVGIMIWAITTDEKPILIVKSDEHNGMYDVDGNEVDSSMIS